MSAPTAKSPLGVTIHCREATYGGDPYKRHQRAKRAFYKWVCKKELFGNLRPYLDHHLYTGRPRIVYRREPAKYTYGRDFTHGYPSYDASRSTARDIWERKINPHIEASRAARAQKLIDRENAYYRLAAVQDNKTRRFFKIMHAAEALAQQ